MYQNNNNKIAAVSPESIIYKPNTFKMDNLILYAGQRPEIKGSYSEYTTFNVVPQLINGLSIVKFGSIVGTPNDLEGNYTFEIAACNENQCSPSTQIRIILNCMKLSDNKNSSLL